jgi:hypothetical protein
MAGRPKEGIEFSGWAADVFEDPKIDKLIDGQGAAGFTIYFYLCQRAFGLHGYFLPWTCDDAASTARRIGGGVGSKTVQDTVGLCLRIGLFDRMLYEGHGILTSRGIQRSCPPHIVPSDENCAHRNMHQRDALDKLPSIGFCPDAPARGMPGPRTCGCL